MARNLEGRTMTHSLGTERQKEDITDQLNVMNSMLGSANHHSGYH